MRGDSLTGVSQLRETPPPAVALVCAVLLGDVGENNGPLAVGHQTFQDAFDRLLPVLSGHPDLAHMTAPDLLTRAMGHGADMMLEVKRLPTQNPLARLMSRSFLEEEPAHSMDPVDGYPIRMTRGELGLERI